MFGSNEPARAYGTQIGLPCLIITASHHRQSRDLQPLPMDLESVSKPVDLRRFGYLIPVDALSDEDRKLTRGRRGP